MKREVLSRHLMLPEYKTPLPFSWADLSNPVVFQLWVGTSCHCYQRAWSGSTSGQPTSVLPTAVANPPGGWPNIFEPEPLTSRKMRSLGNPETSFGRGGHETSDYQNRRRCWRYRRKVADRENSPFRPTTEGDLLRSRQKCPARTS